MSEADVDQETRCKAIVKAKFIETWSNKRFHNYNAFLNWYTPRTNSEQSSSPVRGSRATNIFEFDFWVSYYFPGRR
jgi:hypothetical protein